MAGSSEDSSYASASDESAREHEHSQELARLRATVQRLNAAAWHEKRQWLVEREQLLAAAAAAAGPAGPACPRPTPAQHADAATIAGPACLDASTSCPSSPLSSPAAACVTPTAAATAIASAVTEGAATAHLRAEVARLEAQLYMLHDECVALPKERYEALTAVHRQAAESEAQLLSARSEVEQIRRKYKMLSDEVEWIKSEHVIVTTQEFAALQQEARARQEDMAQLEAAQRRVTELEERLGSEHASGTTEQEQESLKQQLLQARADLASERSAAAAASQEQARKLWEVVAASGQEHCRLVLRVRVKDLEGEVAAVQQQLDGALNTNRELAAQLGAALDANSQAKQEAAELERARQAADMRADAAMLEREALIRDLVAAKVQNAGLKEVEVQYKRQVAARAK